MLPRTSLVEMLRRNPFNMAARYLTQTTAEDLRDEYIATVGGDWDPAEVLNLCMLDPDTAQAHITAAVRAQLHTLADEAMSDDAPAQPRPRARL
ncbi:hypothetical protein [Paraburkholderia sp. C35]|uniref:hypothetical protein n=1 Tax=Paraburkholderia sp. C35 TaxID=2126993 RepID=UPI000D68BD70|nr:hypothetical protein [Paraburkholderia sp. C35]